MLTEWFRPAGVELTRIYPWEENAAIPKDVKKQARQLFPNDKDSQETYINQKWKRKEINRTDSLIQKGQAWSFSQPTVKHFGTDPYCIEVSSTILQNWDQLKEFFTRTDAFLDKHRMLRFSSEVGGTGGHIHISVKDDYEAQKVKRFMANHPEAMFAFAHPCDEHHRIENRLKKAVKRNDYNIYTGDRAYDGKHSPIAYREDYQTVEFRMLDIAQTWEMQEEHMAFAQAFVRYAIAHKQKKILFLDEIETRTVDDHIANFKTLIQLLNLPWNRYKWYTTNIKTRFKFKREDEIKAQLQTDGEEEGDGGVCPDPPSEIQPNQSYSLLQLSRRLSRDLINGI
jgi:hypothetical protein